ncbi:MAG: PAS domain S-box protein [Microcoleus sp. SU_5_6]|nr:PAS domain S-box protein [Microcoleus sp. SU_5_6]
MQIDSIESIIGRSHYEIFPNIPEEWKQFHHSGLAGCIEKCDEDRFAYSDGSVQWLRWEIHPWYRSNGDVGGIILFTENITDRKQAEIVLQQLNAELEQRVAARTAELTEVNDRLLIALLEKEQAYQLVKEQAQLLNLAHDSIITWDLNSAIGFWNQGAEFMYGWTKAEALGQEVHSLLKTQFPQPLVEIKAQLLENSYWEGELIQFTKDERSITVSSRWVVQKDGAGQPIKILEINNDITQRKQAELVLQQYIREVEDLYNNAPCGYHSLDAGGTIVRINDTELKWLGYTRDEVLHKIKFLDLLSPEGNKFFTIIFPGSNNKVGSRI